MKKLPTATVVLIAAVALFCAGVTTASALTGVGKSLCSSAAAACSTSIEGAGTALGLKMTKIEKKADQIAAAAAETANRFLESDEPEEKDGKSLKEKAQKKEARGGR